MATLACALGICVVSTHAAPITIDNFSVVDATWPKDQNSIGSPEIEHIIGSSANLLGEVRKTGLHDFSPGGGISRVEVGVFPTNPSTGFLEYVSSVDTDAAVTLRYDGDPNADGLTPNLNLDMTVSPIINVVFSRFDYAGDLPMDVTVTVSDGINSTVLSQQLAMIVTAPISETLAFDFAARGGPVNLADIDWIEVDFDPGAAADFRVTGISAVPEPSGLALLGLSLLLFSRPVRQA